MMRMRKRHRLRDRKKSGTVPIGSEEDNANHCCCRANEDHANKDQDEKSVRPRAEDLQSYPLLRL